MSNNGTRTALSEGLIAYLPEAVRALVPELSTFAASHDGEPRADCSRCVMLPVHRDIPEPAAAMPDPHAFPDSGHPWAFLPEVRCCTYHPRLANFLAGEVLMRGGTGAEALRARLADPSGVQPWGITESAAYLVRRRAGIGLEDRFGRELELCCPYYVGGTYSCGIWPVRAAACRTWFCKHDSGPVGMGRWHALREVLELCESRVAELCVRAGEPPSAGADADTWAAWFIACAERVRSLGPEDLVGLRDSELGERIAALATAARQPEPELPEVVIPVIYRAAVHDERVWFQSYSAFDSVAADPVVLDVFAELDGVRPWRHTRAVQEGLIGEALIRELHRIAVLQAPRPGEQGPAGDTADKLPDILTPAVRLPIAAGGRVWLQSASGPGSAVAPPSIFTLLARLDGRTPWRQALAELKAADPDAAVGLDEALVRELVRAHILI